MRPVIYLCIVFIALSALFAQEKLPLQQLDRLIVSIRKDRGDVIFAPEFYQYKDELEQLREAIAAQGMTPELRERAQRLFTNLRDLSERSQKALPYFVRVLSLRDLALLDGAEDFASDYFQNGENQLREAARLFRQGKTRKLEKPLEAASRFYRQAQFEAIRNKLLSEVRILIQESRDLEAEKLVPKTFQKVQQLYAEVEKILKKKQYNTTDLQEKADRLAEESQHLLYLAQIARQVANDPANLEAWILQVEGSIRRLAELLEIQPQFSQGIPEALQFIRQAVEKREEENRNLRQENTRLSDSLRVLQKQILDLKNRLAVKKNWDQIVARIRQELKNTGARVEDRGKTVLIRVNGLQFAPGRYDIPQKYYSLLEKVARALQYCSGQSIQLFLKQKAGGNPQYARELAHQRALTVGLFLQSEAYIPDDQFEVQGLASPDIRDEGHVVLELVISKNHLLEY